MDIRIFMIERGDTGKDAKQVCNRCPVIGECLQFALVFDEHEVIGVWGGTTGAERRRIRRHIGLHPVLRNT